MWERAQRMLAAEFGDDDIPDLLTRLRRLLRGAERRGATRDLEQEPTTNRMEGK